MKQFLFALLAVLALASCRKQDGEPQFVSYPLAGRVYMMELGGDPPTNKLNPYYKAIYFDEGRVCRVVYLNIDRDIVSHDATYHYRVARKGNDLILYYAPEGEMIVRTFQMVLDLVEDRLYYDRRDYQRKL